MLIVITMYFIIAFVQIPKLIKKRYWKDLAAFSIFYISAFLLSILYVLGVKLPSPYEAIGYLIEDVLGLKY